MLRWFDAQDAFLPFRLDVAGSVEERVFVAVVEVGLLPVSALFGSTL